MEKKRVVITGVGPVTPIGTGRRQLWDSILRRRSNVSRQEHYIDDELWGSFHIARVSDFRLEDFGFPSVKSFAENQDDGSRDLLYLLSSCKLALDDSRLLYDREDNEVGLALTCENPGVDDFICRIIENTLEIIEGRAPALPDLTKIGFIQGLYERFQKKVYNLQTFMYLHRVSRALGLHGESLFINNACASGLFALEAASQWIRGGRAKAAIVAGADDPSFMTKYLWFRKLGIYSEDGLMRPFDRNRNGLVFGEGGGAIVLEDFDHARARGAPIYAEYLGGGFTQDAWKVTVPSMTSNFYAKAFRQALEESGLDAGEIELINPHGAATAISDRYEALTIEEVFGSRQPLITAFKPYTGHNLGGSAIVELIILLLAMSEGIVPATLNHETPDPDMKIEIVKEPVSRPVRVAAKMSCGFGGYNAVALFKKIQ
jgi:3-oxoacyl-[acyl-carrier-protein] synthase II